MPAEVNVSSQTYAPIVLFLYSRPDHARKTLDALALNRGADKSELFIFCDGPKNDSVRDNIEKVQTLAIEEQSRSRFKSVEVIISEKNKGLANSIIAGVSRVIREYGKCIVLEDDIVTSNTFLRFMNDCLAFYEEQKNIFSVSGFTYPLKSLSEYENDVYLSYRACSHGWATWADRWNLVDWEVKDFKQLSRSPGMRRHFNRGGNDLYRMLRHQMRGERDSWAIRFCYSQSKYNLLTVYPRYSLVLNIGNDGSGTHCTSVTDSKQETEAENGIELKPTDVTLNKKVLRDFKNQYRVTVPEAVEWGLNKIRLNDGKKQ